jgi:thioesterase domain-containing protein
MWRTVINDIERDPTLRGRYQCWVFGYPTGNPPAYSALRLREELAKVKQRYPNSRDYVLVGHSMGGLISQMQVKNIDRDAWNLIGKKKAQQFFNTVPTDSLVNRAVIFQANPNIDRVVFICTPHRGSKMAIGTVGELAMRLIALPANLTVQFTSAVSESVGMLAGTGRRLPNSVSGLSPKNPTLKVLDSRPMTVPHHSIIGDRGKGDTPLSSDGVVEYWSSTMRSAQSEKIVPCPHGACEMPETISELQRILHLHLKEQGNNR